MLIVCPTPIGNLDDVTPRQRQALAGCDVVACEDTRRTGKLLELLGIERRDGVPALVSYHDHNERERAPQLVARMEAGETVVLVSDAGTPAIADPGYRLVRAAHEAGVGVVSLPGPNAAIVALAASGLPTDQFHFEGFLPTASGRRASRLEELAALGTTVVLYESPRRLEACLEEVEEAYGEQIEVVVARELTKLHEELLRGEASRVLERLRERGGVKGEVVVVVAPGEGGRELDVEALVRALHAEELHPRIIKRVVSSVTEASGTDVWQILESLKGDGGG